MTPEQKIANSKRWYAKNKGPLLAKRRQEYDNLHKPERRGRNLWKRYKITLADYQIKLAVQSGCCAICERPQKELKRDLAVDHSHTTGKVRGLLCGRCNLGLAFLENENWNNKAKSYLGAY